MNYISNPERVLKTIQKILYYLNNSKIAESKIKLETLYTSFSIFLKVSLELLGLSKVLYHFLSSVFEYCGLAEKSTQNNCENKIIASVQSGINEKDHTKSVKSFTYMFRPTSFETESGVLLTKPLNKHDQKEMPQVKLISEEETASEDQIDVKPPRISQNYLNFKTSSHRSLSVKALKQRYHSKE